MISCLDCFPALRRSNCMGTSVILSIFSYCWYSLQNQIFLTTNNYLILNRKIRVEYGKLGFFELLSYWKVRVTKSWKFLFHGYIIYSRRIQDFAQISSLTLRSLLHGIGEHQFWGFFPLDIHIQNQIFLTVSRNFWIERLRVEYRQTWIFRTPLGSSPVLTTW